MLAAIRVDRVLSGRRGFGAPTSKKKQIRHGTWTIADQAINKAGLCSTKFVIIGSSPFLFAVWGMAGRHSRGTSFTD
jgi:hypothetical protein